MGWNPREEAARSGAGPGTRPQLASQRRRAKVTPGVVRQILELRKQAPSLGLRRVARAFGLTLSQVRVVVTGGRWHVNPLRRPIRCPGCHAMIRLWPCVRCAVGERE